MSAKKIKIKYEGIYEIAIIFPGHVGIVKPGECIQIVEDVYNIELKDDPRWSVDTKEVKKTKNKEVDE